MKSFSERHAHELYATGWMIFLSIILCAIFPPLGITLAVLWVARLLLTTRDDRVRRAALLAKRQRTVGF